jgi:hypothetical protein
MGGLRTRTEMIFCSGIFSGTWLVWQSISYGSHSGGGPLLFM